MTENGWKLIRFVHINNFKLYIAPALNSIGLVTDNVDWEWNDDDSDSTISGKYIIKKDDIKWTINSHIINSGGRTWVIGLEVTVYDGFMPTDSYKLCVSIDKLLKKTEIIKLK
jgi:hypothetical protein